MPTFLIEDIRIFQNDRMKDRIEINSHQVDEILVVSRTYRIDSLIRIGHRI